MSRFFDPCIAGRYKNHLCSRVGRRPREHRRIQKQWGVTTAESSGSSIMQLPPVASAESTEASHQSNERRRNPGADSRRGSAHQGALCLFSAAASGTFHILSPRDIGARRDSLYKSRSCDGLPSSSRPRVSFVRHEPDWQRGNALTPRVQ